MEEPPSNELGPNQQAWKNYQDGDRLVDVVGVLVEHLLAVNVLDGGGDLGRHQSGVDDNRVSADVGVPFTLGELAMAEAGVGNSYREETGRGDE